ncbi:hypothetical protein C2E31_01785 [Rhodopirellula baltica]|nr:hypothetical protein C2E31_01785 [Rhodopirellula baltica]
MPGRGFVLADHTRCCLDHAIKLFARDWATLHHIINAQRIEIRHFDDPITFGAKPHKRHHGTHRTIDRVRRPMVVPRLVTFEQTLLKVLQHVECHDILNHHFAFDPMVSHVSQKDSFGDTEPRGRVLERFFSYTQ